MSAIQCLIIEDQRPAQRVLEGYIRDVPHLEHVASCSSAMEAIQILQARPVDVIFLDLHLPRIDGFAFLKNLTDPPRVIVTTAFPQHALEGFELDVVDYLLKPISFERFVKAISKLRHVAGSDRERSIRPAQSPPEDPSVAGAGNAALEDTSTTFIKVDGKYVRLCIRDIVYLTSDGDFVDIVTTGDQYYVLGTLSAWSERLPHSFVQVHKSYIVNLDHIQVVAGAQIETPKGTVPIGRAYRERLMERIRQP